MAPQIDTCNYSEAIGPAFDPNRALLRRVFFIGPDKTIYIFIAFYPTKTYKPMIEIGAPKNAPQLRTERHVGLMAEHLPHNMTLYVTMNITSAETKILK
jgi:hypothetical protein